MELLRLLRPATIAAPEGSPRQAVGRAAFKDPLAASGASPGL